MHIARFWAHHRHWHGGISAGVYGVFADGQKGKAILQRALEALWCTLLTYLPRRHTSFYVESNPSFVANNSTPRRVEARVLRVKTGTSNMVASLVTCYKLPSYYEVMMAAMPVSYSPKHLSDGKEAAGPQSRGQYRVSGDSEAGSLELPMLVDEPYGQQESRDAS